MANPVTTPEDGSDAANVVRVFLKYTVGASGALTTITNKNKGILSATRNSAGSYTFRLTAGRFPGSLLSYIAGIIGTYTTAGGTVAIVTVDNSAGASPSVTIVFYAVGTQTATDPANGVTIFAELVLQNGIV